MADAKESAAVTPYTVDTLAALLPMPPKQISSVPSNMKRRTTPAVFFTFIPLLSVDLRGPHFFPPVYSEKLPFPTLFCAVGVGTSVSE